MYSELCEKLFEQNSNNYVAVFNELDKHLDGFVWTEKFLPYNEKIKEIAKGTTQVSLFIKKHQAKLKYFGELRNHIAHGFKLDGKHYAIPSYHALDELRKFKDAILKPITIGAVFKKQVFSCLTTDSLAEIMQSMRNFHYTHVPVYNEQRELQWLLTQGVLCDWLASQKMLSNTSLDNIHISDLDLSLGNERHEMVAESTSLFSIPSMFEHKNPQEAWFNQRRLGALLITENGNPSETLTGLITTFDLPIITQYAFVEE